MTTASAHIPVLKREALSALNIQKGGTYVDATLGRAGHAQEIAQQMGDNGRLIGIDRDPRAITAGQNIFQGDHRVHLLHGDFERLSELVNGVLSADLLAPKRADGVLMDLGVSSPQLDQAERGFSFMRDGDLDMRMDPSRGESAEQWLARVEESDLVKVLFEFGEEKFARRIANAIVVTREQEKIQTTHQLAAIIENNIPKKEKRKHPATRTFQAIRLHINQELHQLSKALPQAVSLLNEGGRLAVISFHSLEDRIVKRFMRRLSTPKLPPKNIPVNDDMYRTPLTLVGRAVKPSKQEIDENPRSRSSVLRVAQRTDAHIDENHFEGAENA